MIQLFTLDEVIRYAYGESTETEKKEMIQALAENPELRKQYREIKAVQARLDEGQLAPSKACTDRIMAYARTPAAAALT